MVKTEEVQGLLDSIYSYTDKKNKQTNAAAAYIVGGEIIGDKDKEGNYVDGSQNTTTGRYKVNINNEVCNLWAISQEDYQLGDLVFVIYWGDLTNGKILCKNR